MGFEHPIAIMPRIKMAVFMPLTIHGRPKTGKKLRLQARLWEVGVEIAWRPKTAWAHTAVLSGISPRPISGSLDPDPVPEPEFAVKTPSRIERMRVVPSVDNWRRPAIGNPTKAGRIR
jgi:hypothetical protein